MPGVAAGAVAVGLMGSGGLPAIEDAFTGADSTPLDGRTPEPMDSAYDRSRPTWTERAGDWQIVLNKAQNASTGHSAVAIDWASADAAVTLTIVTPDIAGAERFAARLIGRYDPSDGSYLCVEINTTTGLQIRWFNGSSFSNLESVSLSLTGNTEYEVSLNCSGTTVSASLDGEWKATTNTVNNIDQTEFGFGEYRDASIYADPNSFDDFRCAIATAMPYAGVVDLVAIGDSITAGQGASDAAHRYVNLIAAAKGWLASFENAGKGGCSLQNTLQNTVSTIGAAQDDNMRDRFAADVLQKYPTRIIIMGGINDLRLDDAAYTASLYQSDLSEMVQAAIDLGVSASNIVIGSPSYVKTGGYAAAAPPYDAGNSTKHDAYSAACSAVATAKGCHYVDTEAAMIAGGGDSLISDATVHPNDAGHAVLATVLGAPL